MKSIKFTFFGKAFMLAFLMFGLVNCNKDKVEEEVIPDFSKTFAGVAVTPITVTKPAATTVTPGSITTPPAVAATAAALAAGTVPADLSAAASKVPEATATAISTGLTPAVLADIQAGKAIPTALANSLADLIKSGAANAFLSTITLPSVDGKPVGGRLAAPGTSNTVKAEQEMLSTMNACNDKIKEAYDAAKKILDDGKVAEYAKIKAAYDENIKAGVVTADKDAALKKKNDALASNLAFLNATLTGISQALVKKTITAEQNVLFTAIVLGIFKDANDKVEALYKAEVAAADAKSKAITDKAKAASDSDTKKVNDEYQTKLDALIKTYSDENNKCHNQGGGN
jgi:hypothetical protein